MSESSKNLESTGFVAPESALSRTMETSGQVNDFTPINSGHSTIKQELDPDEVKPLSKKRASSTDQEAFEPPQKKKNSEIKKKLPPSAPNSNHDTDMESQDMAGKVKADDIPIAPKKEVVAARTKTEQPEARKGSKTHKEPHVKSINIPSCWEEASAADRMLVTMRGQGAVWGKIRALWKDITGQDTATSTLPVRYIRIKTNLMRLEDGDAERLRKAKHQVEDRFRVEKLQLIANEIEKAGGAKYSTVFIAKEIKKMEKPKKDPATAGGGDVKDFGQDLQE